MRARAILKRIRLNDLDTAQIRELMITEGIGVDCSGLAGRILDALVKERVGKSIAQCLQPVQINGHSPLRRIIFRFRPLQNIDVLTLTSEMNCISVTLSDLRPGDLIRTRGGKHVLLITEIERHDNRIMSFAYVHSSGQFGDQSGVREGKVVITNVDGNLGDQDWQEVWEGRKPALEGWREEREKNGIHRLRALI